MKLFKILYLYLFGYVDVHVSGYFTERFANLCFAKSVFLWKLNYISSFEIKARISVRDFKKIKQIAKTSKCKIHIISKKGIPFLLHSYRKRKIFAITLVVVAILSILNENGIKEGKWISGINTEKAINEICLRNKEIAWCGIKIQGTNVIVSLEMATLLE